MGIPVEIRDICPRGRSLNIPVAQGLAVYLPVVGFVIQNYLIVKVVEKEIKKTIEDEKKNTRLVYTHQCKHLIEIRTELFEAGQIRSYITIVLSIACIISGFFPIVAGIIGAWSFVWYLAVRLLIQDGRAAAASLENKYTIPENILAKLSIKP